MSTGCGQWWQFLVRNSLTCDGRGERERDLMVFWVCFMVAREREKGGYLILFGVASYKCHLELVKSMLYP